MVKVKLYPQEVVQSNGTYEGGGINKRFSQFSNLDAIKSGGNTKARANIAPRGQDYDRPATITVKNFGFTIPYGSRINSIKLGYAHNKIIFNTSNNYPEVYPPHINLTNIDGGVSGNSAGYNYQEYVVEFKEDKNAITGWNSTNINNGDFGVTFDYRTNGNTNSGAVELGYIWIEVDYTPAEFALGLSNTTTGTIYPKDVFSFDATITNINRLRQDVVPTVNIVVPADVEVIPDSENHVNYNPTTHEYVWTPYLLNKTEITNSIKFKSSSAGTKTIKLFIQNSTVEVTKNINIDFNTTVIGGDKVPEFYQEDDEFEFEVLYDHRGDVTQSRTVSLEFPPEMSIGTINVSPGTATVQNLPTTTKVTWVIPSGQYHSLLHIKSTINTPNKYSFFGFDEIGKKVWEHQIKITPASLTNPFFAKYVMPPEVHELMQEGEMYTIVTYMRMFFLNEATNDDIEDYGKNCRMVVTHESGIDVNNFNDLLNGSGTQFSEPLNPNKSWQRITLAFNYIKNAPIVVMFTGEYLDLNPENLNIHFSTPQIMFIENYPYLPEGKMGVFPTPLKNLIGVENYGSTNLPSLTNSANFRHYGINMGGVDNIDGFAIQGIKILFDYDAKEPCSILAKVITAHNKRGVRSISLAAGVGTAEIGDSFDLFGLKYSDYSNFSRTEIEFTIINNFQQNMNIDIKNIRWELNYSILDADEWCEFLINGESNIYYKAFLSKLTLIGGSDMNVEVFNVEGNDKHIPYRQNIEPKEIEMEFIVDGCDFEANTLLFHRIARWMMNERDVYNRPIPNEIEFSHIPDYKFKYVMEDGLEEEEEAGTYTVEAKLLVPDGTMEKKESTITNNIGINGGIAKALPKIQVLSQSTEINIMESNSGQSFILKDDSLVYGDLLVINSETRKVTKIHKENNVEYVNSDITHKVDYDSDWIVFNPGKEYNIDSGTSAIVQSVEFKERW
ncbi:MAG: phage tail family protein [Methanobacteriaceae archaeon]|jgi:hypothetical protein|nr:phage tail family protein [Methanobacteriaceae archaeon]